MPYHAAIVSHVLCLCFEAWKLFFELHFINRWTCFHFERPCKTSCNLYSPRDHLVLRLYLQYINLYNCSNYRNERGWARKLLLKIQVLFYLFLPWQLFKKRYVDAKTNLANTSHCTRIKQYDCNFIIWLRILVHVISNSRIVNAFLFSLIFYNKKQSIYHKSRLGY